MHSRVTLICLAPALLLAQSLSPEAQKVVDKVLSRQAAYGKALEAHLASGKPYKDFAFSWKADIEEVSSRLAKAKSQEMRQALGLALFVLRTTGKPLTPEGPGAENMELLKAVPLESPLWVMSPMAIQFLALDYKEPEARSAFFQKVLASSKVSAVRQDILFWQFMEAHRAGREGGWKAALAQMEKEFPKSQQTAMAREEATVYVKVGAPAPAFSVQTLDDPGQAFTLDSFKGKYLLIDFWATWCGPCKAMMPTLHKVYAAYKGKGLEMLSVADDKSNDVVQAFRKQPDTPMPWHQVVNIFDSKTRTRPNPISKDYGIRSLPTLVLIGPDGKVVADNEVLHKNLEGTLARILEGGGVSVDYSALAEDAGSLIKTLQGVAKAHRDSGSKEPFEVDPKYLEPLRDRAKAATGELRQALLVQEMVMSSQCQLDTAFPGAVLKEVKASSPAWKVALDMVPYLEHVLGAEAKPLVAAMGTEGISEVRAVLLAADASRRIGEGDVAGAKAALAQAQALHPDLRPIKQAAAMVASELKTLVGSPAPDFRIQDLEHPERSYTLADFRGKYLLLDFWGTWCGWCVKELPNTHRVYTAFKPKGLEILSVAQEAKAETVQAFRKKPEYPMPWKHALLQDSKEQKDPMVVAYGVMGFPTLILVGPDGRILAKGGDLREESLEKTLAKHLR